MKGLSELRLTAIRGCLVALLIGVLVVALVRVSLWSQTGEVPNLQEGWAAWLMWAVLAAVPFGYLALKGVRSTVAWIAAAVVTGGYWGVLLAVPSVRPQDANDLGAMLLLLLYPVIAAAGARVADRVAHGIRASARRRPSVR